MRIKLRDLAAVTAIWGYYALVRNTCATPRERPRLYNDDKPHRCPACHAITVDYDGAPPARRLLTLASVTCCRCGTEFTRWPNMPVPIRRGVVCDQHEEELSGEPDTPSK